MSNKQFRPGDRVIDVETGAEGRVLFIYADPEIADDFVVVRLNDTADFAVAFPPADLRHAAH
jgi:hypothetical protein